jgi:hypothetical protein
MSKQYDNTNRGSIWRNEKKETDTHPDFTGSLNVAGVDYWVSAWKRKEDAGPKAPALSFSVKPKEARQERPACGGGGQSPPSRGDFRDDDLEDVPF